MKCEKKYINFCGFHIPVLPEFTYREDGLVKGPKVFFIEDLKGILLITLEEGMRRIDDLVIEQEDRGYEAKQYLHENKKLQLVYPYQPDMKSCRMGYFHVELTDKTGENHILPGQMYVQGSDEYMGELKKVQALKELFYGLSHEREQCS